MVSWHWNQNSGRNDKKDGNILLQNSIMKSLLKDGFTLI